MFKVMRQGATALESPPAPVDRDVASEIEGESRHEGIKFWKMDNCLRY